MNGFYELSKRGDRTKWEHSEEVARVRVIMRITREGDRLEFQGRAFPPCANSIYFTCECKVNELPVTFTFHRRDSLGRWTPRVRKAARDLIEVAAAKTALAFCDWS